MTAGDRQTRERAPRLRAAPARKTARDHVADQLRTAILAGELPPGAKLSVDDVAQQLGVSHTPTREAFQALAGDGLVQLNPYRGAYVAELSADEYEEIFLMRLPLEGLAARLGAERIDNAGAAALAAKLEELQRAAEAQDVDAFLTVDRAFHEIHYLASGRVSLWERIRSLRDAAERYIRIGYRRPEVGMAQTAARHRILFEAVQRRDGAAAEAEITSDLQRTFDVIYEELRAGG